MTQAIQSTQLSKLDLFTPSPLYLDLPPLVTAPYPIMGAACIMLSSPDVRARAAHVRSQLGDAARDGSYMRNRRAKHDRIVKHLGITYEPTLGWYVCSEAAGGGGDVLGKEKEKKKTPGSMRSEESRMAYAEKALEEEWRALGMGGLVAKDTDYMACVRGRRGRRKEREIVILD